MRLRLRQINRKEQNFWLSVSATTLSKNDLTVDDFNHAPAFIMVHEDELSARPILEFISGRKRKIVRIE